MEAARPTADHPENENSQYVTAIEATQSQGSNAASSYQTIHLDTASSPLKPHLEQTNEDSSSPAAVIYPQTSPGKPSTSNPTSPRDDININRPSGAALFSVPPAEPPHGGVYDMPLDAFEVRNLDSGETFKFDKRYWIKDVDTGKVYVLQPDVHEQAPSSLGSGGAASSSGRTTPGGGPSMRVSDLLSGQELTLEQFEDTLGYSRDAPPLQAPSPLSMRGESPSEDSGDFAALAQRGMQSLSLAAQASASWIKNTASAASKRFSNPSTQPQPFGAAGLGSPGGGGAADSGSPNSLSSSRALANQDGQGLAIKVNVSRKPFKELTDLRLVQSVAAHQGVVWCMRFSKSGKYLATAGQDGVIAIWETIPHRELEKLGGAAAAGSSEPSSSPRNGGGEKEDGVSGGSDIASVPGSPGSISDGGSSTYGVPVLKSKPLRLYKGHKQDILDLAWSKTNFIISASMDKTVRLWHVSMDECLRVFKHTDFVTAIDFHPSDDKLFISGSIDGKVRLWNVPEQRVASWQDVHDMVTAVGYARDGRRAVVGTMRGKCRFYGVSSKGTLEYEAQLDVKNKRGQHSRGKKVTGLNFAPSVPSESSSSTSGALLITSNDSRIRLYEGYTLKSKYKGHSNKSTQIKAAFSPKGDYVICGSDDGLVYMWSTRKTAVPGSPDKGPASGPLVGRVSPVKGRNGGNGAGEDKSAVAKEKNSSFECFQVANDVVTVALFGPECTHRPLDTLSPTTAAVAEAAAAGGGLSVGGGSSSGPASIAARGQVIIAAGYSGEIKVYENIGLPQWL